MLFFYYPAHSEWAVSFNFPSGRMDLSFYSVLIYE